MKLAAAMVLAFVVGGTACKSDEEESYDNYQACFDDHVNSEMLPVREAIVVCCIDHEINGAKIVCGDTKADCINYLTANLNQTSADTVAVMDACGDYVTQKGM